MFIGYNTNGMAHHDLFDAIRLLAEIGYRGVAITLDHTALPPHASYGPQRRRRVRRLLHELQMRSFVETGARFLLNPAEKHEPTLISAAAPQRMRRMDFYRYAVDCAAELRSDGVSLWSGVLQPGVDRGQAMDWLIDGLRRVLDHASASKVAVGFEPEPGMLIDSLHAYEELLARMNEPRLQLTLDVGHLQCQGEVPIAEAIHRWAERLVNVHLEDMRAGVHQHLMFGEGEIDFPPVLQALADVGYEGGVYVELSRHSHEAPTAARQALEFIQRSLTANP